MKWVAAVVLVALSACGSSAAREGRAAVTGRVLSAPSCPAERAGSPCPPQPVAGAEVAALRSGDVVASTNTDRAGRFRLVLRPGQYVIRATNVGAYASMAQRVVTVTAALVVSLRLVVDSGIR